MSSFLARLLCYWNGHRRGRYVRTEDGLRVFACPRCGRETFYKEKGGP